MLNRLIAHASTYSLGSLLVTLASFVSFPIFTRTFSVAEYGAMNLLSSLLVLLTGIGKLGIQQSIVRFYAEVRAGSRKVTEASFLSTVLIGMAGTGLAVTAVWVLLALLVPASWWNDDKVAGLLVPVSALIVVRVLDSAIGNILQAQQRSILLSTYNVLRKYLGLAAILAIMTYALPHLEGFYLGTFVAEAVFLLAMLVFLARRYELSLRGFCPATFRAMAAFGIPMIAYQISGMILVFGDRYVIQAMMGTDAVGQYSAAYNLCEYVQTILLVSLAQAITPMYVRLWEEKGEDETRRFVERTLRFYVMVAMPIFAGMTAVGPDIVTLLASEKYSQGSAVIPYVIAGMLVDGATPILGAGIYIHKHNRLLIPFVAAAAGLNVALNVALLPRLGLVAAGLATLVSYLGLALAIWWLGSRRLKVNFPLRDLGRFAVLSAAMYLVVDQVSFDGLALGLVLKVLTGILVYALLVLAADRQTREAVLQYRLQAATGK